MIFILFHLQFDVIMFIICTRIFLSDIQMAMNIWANCPWICKADTHIFILSVICVMTVWKWCMSKIVTDVGYAITNERFRSLYWLMWVALWPMTAKSGSIVLAWTQICLYKIFVIDLSLQSFSSIVEPLYRFKGNLKTFLE